MEQNFFTVIFQPFGKRVSVSPGQSIMLAAAENGVPLAADCGGNGSCGRCLVSVRGQGEVKGGDGKLVLACRHEVTADLTVTVPPASFLPLQRLNLEASMSLPKLDTAVRTVELCAPELESAGATGEDSTLVAALNGAVGKRRWHLDLALVRKLSEIFSSKSPSYTVHFQGAEVLGVSAGKSRPLGVAIDLGSTKIAAYLVDLVDGKELSRLGAMNPQIPFGEDVVARLVFASKDSANAEKLRRVTVDVLNELVVSLSSAAGICAENIVCLTIVGNTAMTQLMLGLPVDSLVRAPYRPTSVLPLNLLATEVGFCCAPSARLYVPGAIGGFVGSDHLAMILATGIDRARRPVLGIDIGTNTEIVLSVPSKGLLLSASCASGPAFEGASITHGMRAASGAIDSIVLEEGQIQVGTIDSAPPIGLCGSGIIDGIAVLLRLALLDWAGRLDGRLSEGISGAEEKRWIVVPEGKSSHGKSIWLGQGDVTRIQLAKAAVEAGIMALMEAAQLQPEEVSRVVVAGAFGSYLNVDSAKRIGLIPDFPNASLIQTGNAAGVGARAILISAREKRRAEKILQRVNHLDLSTDPKFKKFFSKALRFKVEGPESF